VTAALTEVCPEDFSRAGAIFGQVAERLTGTIAQAHRSAEVDWVGPPGQAYRHDLDQLVADLRRIQRAYDSACDALVAYSRSLVQVRDLAVRSASLAAQAASLEQQRMIDAAYLPIVIHPMTAEQERLQLQSRLLSEAADRVEYSASTSLAIQLRDLADDAPRLSGWQSANRSLGSFGTGVGQQIAGGLSLAANAYLGIPGVGDSASREAAREALKQEALAMVQPWLGIEALLRQLGDGQFAKVTGTLSAGLVLRKLGPVSKKNEFFGTHDDLPRDVLRSMYDLGHGPDLAATSLWLEQHAQREFVVELERLQKLPLPGVEELIAQGGNLLLQEGRGGHTLLKHVGRDLDFLIRRQAREPDRLGHTVAKSSFVDLHAAQTAVAHVLADRAAELRKWAALSTPAPLRLDGPLGQPAGLVLNIRGQAVAATRGIVVLVRNHDGSIRIATAYLEA
jgi:hypothetical protein